MQKENEKVHDVAVVEDEKQESAGMEVVQHGMPSAYNLPTAKQIEEYEVFLNNYDAFVNRMLKEGVDYGVIPGVEKPSLLKPGAEKLEKFFFLRSKKDCILKEVKEDGSFIRYTYRTTIFNKSGQVVSTCEGTCNSHEKKYRFQMVFDNQATPEQKKEGKLEERTSKNGKPYKCYIIEKKDFYDIENTIMKMAQKRSYVGAILEATNSSSRFTQDVEDMDPAAFGGYSSPKGSKSKEKAPAKPSAKDAMYAKIKNTIEAMTDGKALEDMLGKLEKSSKYDAAQKKELVDIISKKLKALKK